MTRSPKQAEPGKQKDKGEEDLDKAIAGTFPASDPVAPDAGRPARRKKGEEDEVERELDEALDETFPASDPVPLHDPDQPDRTRR